MGLGNPGLSLGTRSVAAAKKLFWDSGAVIRAAGRAQANAARRYGGYLRRVGQTSMRYKKGASPAGQPPHAHKDKALALKKKKGKSKHNGAMLREFIFNVRDPSAGSQLIGPTGFKTRGGGQPVPSLHEHGGVRQANTGEKIAVKNPAGRNPKTGRFYSRGVQLVDVSGKTMRYPKRPTMLPALMKTKTKFPLAFRNSFTR